jgi:alpha-L-rhamnosidase
LLIRENGVRTLLTLFLGAAALFGGPLAPARLRVEYLFHPEGIDVTPPRFSWIPGHTEKGQKQTAYQIQVSCRGAVVWDSGKVNSAGFTQVEYAGKSLTSDTDYTWTVKYWDSAGASSVYSAPDKFSTGLLKPTDWKAEWITGGNLLSSSITLAKPVRRARVFVAAAGYYELHLNRHRVGGHMLDPAWTEFDKRMVYSVYDVSGQIANGENNIAALMGRGWWGKDRKQSPRLLLQLQGEYTDGTAFVFGTGPEWHSEPGPVKADDIYDGETYDARETAIKAVEKATVSPMPGVTLSWQAMPAIEVVDTFVPHKMTEPQAGVYVFDFGQNFSGWAQIKVRGPAGTKVRIRYAETLHPDGNLSTENLRTARAADTFILAGTGDIETYEPHFTYHGFRYAELTGLPGAPTLDTIRGRVVHTNVVPIGGFSSSNPMLNALQHAMTWGIKTNLHSTVTDCDQRDERLGWMADAHLSAETAIFDFDMAAFYTNFLRDIRDAQASDGAVPNVVPYITRYNPNRVGDPAWGAAYPFILRFVYEAYGDRRAISEHYEGIRKFADYLHSRAPDGLMTYSSYGDWVPVDSTPKLLAATWAYIETLDTVAKAANVLGKESEASTYKKLAQQARDAFNKKWLTAEGHYVPGNQAAQVLALAANIATPEAAKSATSYLVDLINYHDNAHLTTGILATKYLWPVLIAARQPDLAYDVLTQPDYPGYGFMLNHGATTLWELWQERTGGKMNSHNHHMFASVGTFLYRSLAGINATKPGYETIRIEPQMVHGLDWAAASTETVRGLLSSAWHKVDTGYTLDVTVPFGSTATIVFPKLQMTNPTMSGTLEVGSGTHHFVVKEKE